MTEIDKKIVAFIVDYYKEHQFYPTYSEIAEGIQRAKSTVHIYIKNLEEEGIIIRKTNCSSRYRLLNMDFINGIRGSSTTEQISFQQIVIAIRKELLKHEELYEDVWEVLKRHCVNPHPCYRAGWNRCSCAMCIFSTPKLFAGIRELYPEEYALLKQDEKILGFTLDNKCDLDTFVGNTKSCVYHGDKQALRSLITGEFAIDEVYVKEIWKYPAGAFHGAEGGPC